MGVRLALSCVKIFLWGLCMASLRKDRLKDSIITYIMFLVIGADKYRSNCRFVCTIIMWKDHVLFEGKRKPTDKPSTIMVDDVFGDHETWRRKFWRINFSSEKIIFPIYLGVDDKALRIISSNILFNIFRNLWIYLQHMDTTRNLVLFYEFESLFIQFLAPFAIIRYRKQKWFVINSILKTWVCTNFSRN